MPLRSGAVLFVAALVAGCSALGGTPVEKPIPQRDDIYRNGSLLSDEGGIQILGPRRSRPDEDQGGGGIGVNSFLWRASLDTVSFLPVAAADPFGGTIITDWYAPPDAPNERFKVNVFILGRQLRSDGVRVTVFRQSRGTTGQWSDVPVGPQTASELENAILARARELRVAQAAG